MSSQIVLSQIQFIEANQIEADFEGFQNGSAAFFDADGDGDQDLFISGNSNSTLPLNPITNAYYNEGNGSYSIQTENFLEQVDLSSISFADVDNDGDQDLLIAGRTEPFQLISKLYFNNGD